VATVSVVEVFSSTPVVGGGTPVVIITGFDIEVEVEVYTVGVFTGTDGVVVIIISVVGGTTFVVAGAVTDVLDITSTGVVTGLNVLDFVGVLVTIRVVGKTNEVRVVGFRITSEVEIGGTCVDVSTSIYSEKDVVVVTVSTGMGIDVRGVITVVHDV